MADVLELDLGEYRFVLDGRVLEIFGPIKPDWILNQRVYLSSWRFHVTQLNVKATGPDGKGLYDVAFFTLPGMGDKDGLPVVTLSKLDYAQRSSLQPLFDAIAKGIGAAAPASGSAVAPDQAS
jgi:hypothetical protein